MFAWACLVYALTAAAPRDAAFVDNLVGGTDAIALLGLDKLPAQLPVPGAQQAGGPSSPAELRDALLRDADLRVDVSSMKLVYTCRGLGGGMAAQQQGNTSGRRLMSGHNHNHDHHPDHPDHQDAWHAGGHGHGTRRRLQQLVPADQADPTGYAKNAAGLPLLHR